MRCRKLFYATPKSVKSFHAFIAKANLNIQASGEQALLALKATTTAEHPTPCELGVDSIEDKEATKKKIKLGGVSMRSNPTQLYGLMIFLGVGLVGVEGKVCRIRPRGVTMSSNRKQLSDFAVAAA